LIRLRIRPLLFVAHNTALGAAKARLFLGEEFIDVLYLLRRPQIEFGCRPKQRKFS
jgi:hypothetical protein